MARENADPQRGLKKGTTNGKVVDTTNKHI